MERHVETRRKRIWPAIAAVGIAAVLGAGVAYGPGLVEQAEAGTAYGARIACSCHFIGGRDLDQCRADFEPGMGLVRLSLTDGGDGIVASVPGLASTRANYSAARGCMLEPLDD